MKKILFFFLLAYSFAISGNAQLKYRSDGTLTLGNVNPVYYYNANIEGYGTYFTRLANNTFFEICLGATSPRLAGAGNQVVFYNSETSTFNSIQVQNVYTYSDRKAKTNINPVNDALSKIMNLNPVSYNWKDSASGGVKKLASGEPQTDIGFIAQDVEQIIPQAVYIDPEGRRLLNYSAIVSVLTKSVQELTKEVNSLKDEIATLKGDTTSNASLGDASFSKNLNNEAKLYQNVPNPFNNQASIQYSIPKITQGASISIYNLEGKMLFQKQVNNEGIGVVTFAANQLSPGVYLYSLIVDNKIIDTKKMVITK